MKIETVIECCNDCKHRKIYSLSNNTHRLSVCRKEKPFIIDEAANDYAFDRLAFPDNCPLPDYPKPEEGLPINSTLKPSSE